MDFALVSVESIAVEADPRRVENPDRVRMDVAGNFPHAIRL